jgi:hypothetical protein
MKLSYLFIANALFIGLSGLGMLLMPVQLLESYGAMVDANSQALAQLIGILALGMAITSWLARNLKEKDALVAILSGFAVSHLGAAVLAYLAMSQGVWNTMTWFDIAAHLVLGGGFAYYLYNRMK